MKTVHEPRRPRRTRRKTIRPIENGSHLAGKHPTSGSSQRRVSRYGKYLRDLGVLRGELKFFIYCILAVPLLLTSPASGAEFTVLRPQQSNIAFVSKQMGVPVEGSFRRFTARIAVDPARPEAGTARIDIDLASIDTGNAEADAEVAGKAWFDVKNHPAASFISSGVKQSGAGRYEALGKLTIKGKSLDVRAPFTLKQNADTLIIDGVFPLKRLDYGIGSGIWSDTDTVADEVQIRFHLAVAKKQPL